MIPAHGKSILEDRKKDLVLVLGQAVKLDAPPKGVPMIANTEPIRSRNRNRDRASISNPI